MGTLVFVPLYVPGGIGTGNVTGPAGATDSAVALYDGVTGQLIKNSLMIVDGAGNVVTPGTVNGRDIVVDGAKLDTIAVGATNTPLSVVAPDDVTKTAASVGVSSFAARADHKHDITTASAIELTDSTDSEGTASTLARSDHTHAHGNRGGGSLHDVATTLVAGFMSAADKIALNNAATLSAAAPVNVSRSPAVAGVATDAARADHKHDIDVAAAIEITDSTNGAGTASTLVRSDHTHAHGNRGGGSLHALVVAGGAAGFMSGSDKTKLDGIPASPSVVLMWGANSIAATTSDRFLFPGFGNSTANTTTIRFLAPRAGTLRNLYVYHNTPAGNGNAIVYTVRLNGVNTALTVSMASTDSQGTNLVNTVAVAAGQQLSLIVTKALSIGSSPVDVVATLEFV